MAAARSAAAFVKKTYENGLPLCTYGISPFTYGSSRQEGAKVGRAGARALRARALSFYKKKVLKSGNVFVLMGFLLQVAILKGQRQILDTNHQYFGRRAKRGGFSKNV